MGTEGTKTGEPTKAATTDVHGRPVYPRSQSRPGIGEAIVKRNVLWAMGLGILPFPLVDLIGAVAIHAKMLKELSELYEVPYSEDAAKKIVSTLLSSVGGVGLGTVLAASLSRAIPVVGPALGVLGVSVTMGAFTLATGRVFIMHFDAGGTFLDFDAAAMREHFRREFELAKATVAKMREEERAGASTTSKSL
jgi:uncharacterized protein (DUF697 family)